MPSWRFVFMLSCKFNTLISHAKITLEERRKFLYDNVANPDYPENGGWEKLAWNNRAVIVTAQKGEEGVVYVVPMIQLGTGNLDASAALRYDGFGRILAVSATCY